ncbi:hypothetical protein RvY_04477 [Ramazzottius varieornatus]|uniref:Uncharacterized protein n=1 Tax=Ramazzottius varieornatus TaxID=947166 RepID=A0A1D1UXH8_RAMVA|nr:hypothetical protein RvY_04477 [Ramazzottius varieornatus]
MEPLLELIHVVSLPLGFSQRNLVHRFANHRSLGTKTALAIVARNGTGLTAQQAQDASFISSNKVEGVNSALKTFLRKHNGYVYNRVWLALEEYIYHRNKSGSAAFADVRQ